MKEQCEISNTLCFEKKLRLDLLLDDSRQVHS